MRLFLQFSVLCLSVLLPTLQAQEWSSGQGDPFALEAGEFLPVTEAYSPVPSVNGQTLHVDWQISEGYYLYRDRFDAATAADGQRSSPTPHYAEAITKDDPYFGESAVYYTNAHVEFTDLPDASTYLLKLTAQGCADAGLCYPPHDWFFKVKLDKAAITESDETAWLAATNSDSAQTATGGVQNLWLMLLFALLGGAILNLMPCVFPVLGLKVLSFTSHREGTAPIHGLVYSAGVVLSFIAVALLLVALKNAGAAVGWGFQLQTPWFVALLSCLFFVLSLNLLGAFEINLISDVPGRNLSQRNDYVGSFFTGILATVVASPCTAPFMGTAVGFAATQSAATAIAVFSALGAGMALPVLVLTFYPQALKSLPRSGAWMEHFKQFLGFPLLATAIWLVWVTGRQTGADGMAVTLLAWLAIGFGIWLVGLGGRISRPLGVVTVLLSVLLVAAPQLDRRAAPAELAEGKVVYSEERLQNLLDAGHPVFLDVTADWCITCRVNERVALHTDAVQAAFAERGVVYMVADWTLYDERITALLSRYQRNGIPLYLLYTPGKERARILPQLLTQSQVLTALKTLD